MAWVQGQGFLRVWLRGSRVEGFLGFRMSGSAGSAVSRAFGFQC